MCVCDDCVTVVWLFIVCAVRVCLCRRMMNIIDGLARKIQDPQIAVHISNVSSAVESVIRISITFVGYENPKYVLFISQPTIFMLN